MSVPVSSEIHRRNKPESNSKTQWNYFAWGNNISLWSSLVSFKSKSPYAKYPLGIVVTITVISLIKYASNGFIPAEIEP